MVLRWLLLAAALLTACWAGGAAAKEYGIPDYDVTVRLTPDGAYRITETIRFRFRGGSFSYAYRKIPDDHISSLEVVGVRSDQAAIRSVNRRHRNGQWRIVWTFDDRHRPATFTVRYRVKGALFAEEGRNLVDWDVIGPQWSVPVRDVDATFLLPGAIADRPGEIQARPAGTVDQAGDGWRLRFHRDRVAPGDRFRVRIRFPRIMAARTPGSRGLTLNMALAGAGLAFLPGLLPGFWTLFRARPQPGPKPVPTQTAPDLPPGQATLLLGLRYRGYGAALFRLAQRGRVTLIQRKRGWMLSARDKVTFELHPGDDQELSRMERAVLDELREADSLRELGGALFLREKPLWDINRDLVENGLLADRTGRAQRHLLKAIGAGHAVGLALLAGLVSGHFLYGVAVAGLPLGLVVGWGTVAGRRYPRTDAGARKAAETKAFFRGVRRHVQETAASDPHEGTKAFLSYLPWMLLDRKIGRFWMKRLSWKLKRATRTAAVLPPWLVVESGKIQDATEAVEDVLLDVVQHTTAHVGGAGAGGGGAGGGGGGGGGGGAGGGGGGAG